MKHALVLLIGGNNPTSGGPYYYGVGAQWAYSSTTEGELRGVMPGSGTLRNFRVLINSPVGAGNTVTWALRKKVSGTWTTVVSIAISGASDVSGSDLSTEVTFVQGDLFAVQVSITGTPTARFGQFACECDPTDPLDQYLLGGSSDLSNLTRHFGIGWNGALLAGSANTLGVVPTGGKFTKIVLDLDVAPGSGKSRTADILLNGSASTTLQVVCSDSETQDSTTADLSLSAGDTVCFVVSTSGTPASARYAAGVVWRPTTNYEAIYFTNGVTSTSANRYASLGGNYTGGTENSGRVIVPAGTFRNIYAIGNMNPAPGGHQVLMRLTGVSTSLLTTVNAATTVYSDTDWSHSVDVLTDGFLVWAAIGIFPVSSPAGVDRIQIGIVHYAPPPDLATGCAHYLKLENNLNDEIGGVAFTASGTSFTGTAKLGSYALDASAGSKYAYLGDANFVSLTTAFTVAGWVRFVSSVTDKAICGKGTSADECFSLIATGASDLRGYISDSSNVSQAVNTPALGGNLMTGEWYFVVMTYDAGLARIAVWRPSSGGFWSTFTGSLPSSLRNDAQQFEIGRCASDYVPGGVTTDAYIDGFGVWSRALAFTELVALYNAGSGDESWLPAGGGGLLLRMMTDGLFVGGGA